MDNWAIFKVDFIFFYLYLEYDALLVREETNTSQNVLSDVGQNVE